MNMYVARKVGDEQIFDEKLARAVPDAVAGGQKRAVATAFNVQLTRFVEFGFALGVIGHVDHHRTVPRSESVL